MSKSAIDNVMNAFEGAETMGSARPGDFDSPFSEPTNDYEVLPAGKHDLVLAEVIVKEMTGENGPWTQLRFRFEDLKTGAWSSFACGANFGPKAAFAKTWVHQLAADAKHVPIALRDKANAWRFVQSCVGNLYTAMTTIGRKDGKEYSNIISLSFSKKKGTFEIPDPNSPAPEEKVVTPTIDFEEDLPF